MVVKFLSLVVTTMMLVCCSYAIVAPLAPPSEQHHDDGHLQSISRPGEGGGSATGGSESKQPRQPRAVPPYNDDDALQRNHEQLMPRAKPLTPHQMRQMLRAHDWAVKQARGAAREREAQHASDSNDSDTSERSTTESVANTSGDPSAAKRKATAMAATPKNGSGLSQHGSRKRWIDLFGGSSVESRFPLPERRQFPEVDWRGFNEDVFHESFGDFSPVKRWRRRRSNVDKPEAGIN